MSHNSTSHLISFYLCKFRNWYKLMFYLNFLLTNKQFLFVFEEKRIDLKEVLKKISNLSDQKDVISVWRTIVAKKIFKLNFFFFLTKDNFFLWHSIYSNYPFSNHQPNMDIKLAGFYCFKEQKKYRRKFSIKQFYCIIQTFEVSQRKELILWKFLEVNL